MIGIVSTITKGTIYILNILVYDIAADSGGALSILSDFYIYVCGYEDKSVHWHFILSTPQFLSTANVHIHRYPQIKQGWHKRLQFDYAIASKIVEKYEIDKILSLQNIPIPFTDVPQIVYLHQSLQFYDGRISFWNKNQRRYWIYKNIVGKKIMHCIGSSSLVIVQSEWMRDMCIENQLVSEDKIKVISPGVPRGFYPMFDGKRSSFRTFFYPASGAFYKNHKVILSASKLLIDSGIKTFRLVFTLSKSDSEGASIYREAKRLQLPVCFVGQIDRDDVMANFGSCVLLFPSLIETYGLPLTEAAKCNTPVIASDLPFAREALSGYSNVVFFNSCDEVQLADIMFRTIHREIPYHSELTVSGVTENSDSVGQLVREVMVL